MTESPLRWAEAKLHAAECDRRPCDFNVTREDGPHPVGQIQRRTESGRYTVQPRSPAIFFNSALGFTAKGVLASASISTSHRELPKAASGCRRMTSRMPTALPSPDGTRTKRSV